MQNIIFDDICFRQFAAADSDDLWNNLQLVVSEDYPDVLPEELTVPLIMTTWETQAGFPIIYANRYYVNRQVVISQVS